MLVRIAGPFGVVLAPTDPISVMAAFKTAGVSDHVDHKYGPEGHRFYKDLVWPFIENALLK